MVIILPIHCQYFIFACGNIFYGDLMINLAEYSSNSTLLCCVVKITKIVKRNNDENIVNQLS